MMLIVAHHYELSFFCGDDGQLVVNTVSLFSMFLWNLEHRGKQALSAS